MNIRVDVKNGKDVGMVKGRAQKFQWFSRKEFWNNSSCLILYPTFGLGGLWIWDKEEAQNISKKKRNRRYIGPARSKRGNLCPCPH